MKPEHYIEQAFGKRSAQKKGRTQSFMKHLDRVAKIFNAKAGKVKYKKLGSDGYSVTAKIIFSTKVKSALFESGPNESISFSFTSKKGKSYFSLTGVIGIIYGSKRTYTREAVYYKGDYSSGNIRGMIEGYASKMERFRQKKVAVDFSEPMRVFIGEIENNLNKPLWPNITVSSQEFNPEEAKQSAKKVAELLNLTFHAPTFEVSKDGKSWRARYFNTFSAKIELNIVIACSRGKYVLTSARADAAKLTHKQVTLFNFKKTRNLKKLQSMKKIIQRLIKDLGSKVDDEYKLSHKEIMEHFA